METETRRKTDHERDVEEIGAIDLMIEHLHKQKDVIYQRIDRRFAAEDAKEEVR